MAIRPDYNIGELTLVASSANFTTSGSSLQTAAVQAGDAIIAPSGHVLIIASITGQNSGTLFLPCPAAAAGTDLPLRIRFQPDGSRYQGAARDLISRWGGSGNVDALAGLVGENGKLPIFTGAGTMGLVDEGDLGIQDPNGNLGELAGLADVDNLTDLAGLALAARQILQTDGAGALKAVALAANKALVTNGDGDVAPIDLGTLGRALLALAEGTTSQYVRGDGTLQTLSKSAVGLGNVDNTSDANKSVNYANNSGLVAGLSVRETVATFSTGTIGSYAMARTNASVNVNPAQNASGSDLVYANGNGSGSLGVGSGSWRCMGHAASGGPAQNSTLWLRYA